MRAMTRPDATRPTSSSAIAQCSAMAGAPKRSLVLRNQPITRRLSGPGLGLLGLEGGNLRLQVPEFLAREEADPVQRLELLFGPCEVAHLQVGLAQVFVGTLVVRIDRERL